MKRRPVLVLSGALGCLLAACVSNADPFAADKPKGPVKPALYEPQKGVYLGAALDVTRVGSGASVVPTLASQMSAFNKQMAKPHALQMHFLQFPNPAGEFGTWEKDANGWISAQQFAQACERAGATPILTLEPFAPGLYADWKPGSKAFEATRAFAQQAGAWKKPLFIRFAHEMNGSWYPWAEWMDKNMNMRRDAGEETGVTPEYYRRMYRNVALVFRRYAPNAALIWCPNSGLLGGERRDVFRPWYPGDDVVDWVGLDVYERGWTLPNASSKLWGGQFAHNLTRDMTDDPQTSENESVNFYLVYGQWKRKPIMICETGATLSYRSDLPVKERARLNRDWKIGVWSEKEYGWIPSVYGTSDANKKGWRLQNPIDQEFPMVKAIVWFHIGKREFIPAQGPDGKFVWFENEWADYRIGGGVSENDVSPYAQQEVDVYRGLIANPYFLSKVQPTNLRTAATPVTSKAN